MSYLFKSFFAFLLTLFSIITLTFFLMKAIPGDPFSDEQMIPETIRQQLNAHYGLDRPLFEQYGKYLLSVAKGDFGLSLKYRDRSVNAIIAEGFPVSGLLGLQALLFSLCIGIALGSLSAYRAGRWQDITILLGTILAVSIPSFILATLFQYLLALKINLLPVARWESWEHTILPTLALAALPTAFITRLTRSSMIEVFQQPYIRAGRARGIQSRNLIFKHALRNALLPVVAYMGQLTANVMIGSFVIEKIFGIPGIGQWLVNSILNRDYPMIMGITLFYSLFLISANFTAELALAYLDPRISHD